LFLCPQALYYRQARREKKGKEINKPRADDNVYAARYSLT